MAQTHVFTYGTLMAPEVMQAVTGRTFTLVPAVLSGYVRRTIKGKIYPGMTVREGHSVSGALHLDVDDESIRRLTYFEGDEYEPREVEVSLADGSVVRAITYMARTTDLIDDREWNFGAFRSSGMADFIETSLMVMEHYAGELP